MKENESKALQQVWEWKDRAYKEVEHLSTDQALKKRLEDSLQTVYQLELPVSDKVKEQLKSSTPKVQNV
jgi:hypothetical protein